ncbi:LLM class flavin-dependent oxidoreductase [Amycolatopsis methanolica]|nr:LLM class flavin-dependent oxidoreductase [Amycolatopsis methanolica]
MEFSRRTLGLFAASAGFVRAEPPAARAPVGLVLSHEQFPTSRLLDFAFVWASDNLQPWQDDQGHSMFPRLTLALVGERARRVTFGSGVPCPSYRHHPTEVAQAFASLDLLAPGRTFLGVGTGEAVNEQAGTGHYGRYAERHDRLVEAITLIRRLWTGERVTFRGRFFSTDQLKLYDLPSKPPPVYVAAQGPKSARLGGQYGDGWITQAGASLDPAPRDAFAAGARAAGRTRMRCRNGPNCSPWSATSARSTWLRSVGGSRSTRPTCPTRRRSRRPRRRRRWRRWPAAGRWAPIRPCTSRRCGSCSTRA